MTSTEWLDRYIEPEIRPIVKLLRDNGVNTECSCGHEMYVQCHWQQDAEVTDVFNLLWNSGYRGFTMTFHHDALPYLPRRWYEVRFDLTVARVVEDSP